MTRLVLTVLLLGFVSARAQTYLTLAERKKPLSEAVEKPLVEFVDKCLPEKEKQLTAHMEEVMKAVDEAVKLTEEEKTAMAPATKQAVEAAAKAWREPAIVAMRTYLSRTSDLAATRHIAMWKPDVAGPNEPVENWTPPQEDAKWIAALRQTLGEERFKAWSAADTSARKKTDKEIDDYLERWVTESRGPMNEDLQAKIDLMKSKLELPDDRVASLKKAAEALLDSLTGAERERAAGMLRTMPTEARRNIMGRSYFYVRFDRPRGAEWEKLWVDAAAKGLPAEMIARWRKIAEEESRKDEKELAEMIKPSEIYARQQMETTMIAEVDNIIAELGLDEQRKERLKQLSDAAVEESLKLARPQWLQQARNYSMTERKRMRTNTYFGLNEEQQAQTLPVWKDGLKNVLTEEERTRMQSESEGRERRALSAIARTCVAEMDRTLMLNDDQRAKLQPLLLELMRPMMEQRRQQYWSHSPQQLFQNAGKAKEEAVRAILDDVQWRHWQELVNSTGSSPRSMPPMNGTQPEVPDIEAAISTHLYKMFVTERKRVLAVMLPRVEDAQRVLSLPEETVERLTTAAKGAVEQSMAYWRQNTERYVRQSVQTATSKNILQALAGTERVSFSRGDENSPQSTEVWRDALKAVLTKEQLDKLEAVAQARHQYRLDAMAAMAVTEVDRRRRLTDTQCVKLETQVQKLLTEYQPDIERYMSSNWYLQYYYALVPLAGIPEKEMQSILTPQQWKLCKDRDLPDAMQYWEGIENNHKSRLKRGAGGAVNQLFFNGGMLIDE